MGEGEQSEFNFALEFLKTIRVLLNICVESSAQMDLERWYKTLLALRRELYDDMSDKRKEEINEMQKQIHPQIQLHIRQRNTGRLKVIPLDIYTKLDKFELTLRKVIKEKGYKGRMMAGAEESLMA